MSKNKKILLVAILIVILLILFFLIWLYFQGTGLVGLNLNQPTAGQTSKLPTTTNKNVNASPLVTPEQRLVSSQAEVKRFAAAFAERFGSYSNESEFENIKDAKVMMTSSLATWADGYIQTLSRQEQSPNYYGLTTKALSVKLTDFNEETSSAKAVVKCQRIESQGTTTNQRIFYQDLSLDLKKVAEKWLVDSVKWEK